MKRKMVLVSVVICVCGGIILALITGKPVEDSSWKEDEIGLNTLKMYARSHSLKIDDFEQPTIWAQLTSYSRKDPRGPCITVCYKTKEGITPRHILLLFITPRTGIIDQEVLIENLAE